jgi:hypothetical protein
MLLSGYQRCCPKLSVMTSSARQEPALRGAPHSCRPTARAAHGSALQPHRGCVPTAVLPWVEARGMRVSERHLLGGNRPARVALPSASNSTGARESADAALNEARTVAACSCATQERASLAVRGPHLVSGSSSSRSSRPSATSQVLCRGRGCSCPPRQTSPRSRGPQAGSSAGTRRPPGTAARSPAACAPSTHSAADGARCIWSERRIVTAARVCGPRRAVYT